MIELCVEPRIVKSWEQFVKKNPKYSIALDGYVRGGPKEDLNGPYANFNHHEEVHPLATRSTCGQVYMAIKDNLFDTFNKDGEPHANLYVNDPDQDVCVAVWLLQNFERIKGTKNEPLINRLVGMEDLLDTFAGAYPMNPSEPILKEFAWIFAPYSKARVSEALSDMGADEMKTVIESVCERIMAYTDGEGEQLELETDYEELGGGDGWLMIKEKGPHARTALYAKGIKAFVSVKSERDPFVYVIGKMSTYYSTFPIKYFCSELNKLEGLKSNSVNCWGGSAKIIGSPRKTGSKLSPEELANFINDMLK